MKYLFVLITLFCIFYDAKAQTEIDFFLKGKMLYDDYLYDEAKEYLLKAAKKEQGKAYFLLGEIYSDKDCPLQNDSLASESYRKGAELGDLSSMVKRAAILLDRKNGRDSLLAKDYIDIAKSNNIGEAFFLSSFISSDEEEKELLRKSYNQGIFDYRWTRISFSNLNFSLMSKDTRRQFFEKFFYENPNSWLFYDAVRVLGRAWSEFCNEVNVDESKAEKGYPFYYKGISRKHSLYSHTVSSERLFSIAAYMGDKEAIIKMVKLYGDFGYFTKLSVDDWTRVGSQMEVDRFNAIINDLRISASTSTPQELTSRQNYYIGAFLEKDTTKAIMFLQEAVKQGNKQAFLHLGLKIKDPLKSLSYFLRAEDEGILEAKYELYKLSKRLVRSSQNTIEVCNITEGATKEQYIEAANMYINAYRNGCIYVKETDWRYYYGSANSITGRGQKVYKLINEKIAECYYRAGEYDKVIELLNDSMVIKSSKGLTYLGLCYYHGYGVNVNREYAKSLLEKAAELKDGDAMFALGNNCRKSGDYENAVHWYLRSSHFGNKDAMKNLALCYDRGLGVDKDSNKARIWMYQNKH